MDMLYKIKLHLKDILMCLSIIICFGLIIYCLFRYNNNNKDELFISQNSNDNINQTIEEAFYVDIKGEVNNPGVYKVNSQNIVNDIITLAGGFTKNAYKDNLNLSKKVINEMVIFVYNKNKISSSTASNQECQTNTADITSCLDKQASIIIVEENLINDNNISYTDNQTDSNNETNTIININKATSEELQTLNGIGETKALAIIEYRNTNGNFTTIEDILNVNGIGEAIYNKIKDYITV